MAKRLEAASDADFKAALRVDAHVATAFADLGVKPRERLRYGNCCATLEACRWRVRCIEEDSSPPFPLPPSLHHYWEEGWKEHALPVQHPPRNRRDRRYGRQVN
jgi:hypothetical protein